MLNSAPNLDEFARALLDASPEAMLVVDVEGLVLCHNARAVELFGYPPERLAGRPIGDLLSEFEVERLAQSPAGDGIPRWLRSMEGHSDVRALRRDGSMQSVDLLLKPALLGGQACVIATVRVSTDRRRVEESAPMEPVFPSSMINSVAIGFCVFHELPDFPRLRFTVWNSYMTDVTGYTVEEINRRGWDQLVYPNPEMRERFLSRMNQMRSGVMLQNEEWEITRSDGGNRILSISTSLIGQGSDNERVLALMQDVTVRATAEKGLQQAREFLEAALAQSPSGVLIASAPDVTIRVANREAFRIRGGDPLLLTDIEVSRHAARWQTFRPDGTSFPPEELPLSRAVLLGETTQDEDVIIRDETGQDHWVSANAAPIRDAQGRITHGIVIFHDITARKRTEETVLEREARLRAILDTEPECVKLLAADGTLLEMNPAGLRMIEADSLEQVRNRCIFPLVAAEHRDSFLNLTNRVFKGESGTLEFQIVGLKGARRWMETRATPLRDASGKITALLAITHDITDRRLAQEQLRRREEYFRLLIENATDIITVIDMQSVISYVSPSTTRVLGYSAEDVLGRQVFDIVHPDDLALTAAAIQRALGRPAIPKPVEIRFRHKDGSWRLLESIGQVAPSLAGDKDCFVVNSRDITESRRIEEHYRHSQKMEAIGQLAGGVAHDFNNILAVVMMQIELISATPDLPEEAREGLMEIAVAAKRASDLTRQLLFFSRRQVIQLSELDVNEVIGDLARMLQRLLGEQIRLQLHFHPSPLIVRADRGMLDQVLMNLSVNARDAMSEGGVLRIETTATEVGDEVLARLGDAVPGPYVRLEVSDTGTGIPPEVLPRIFEPFFTTKEVGKGSGLGLATTFGIVKQHHGWIDVRSASGEGTCFQVYLPALTEARQPTPAPSTRPVPAGGTETILVVEDEPALLRVIRTGLEQHGYRVLEAGNGVEAERVWGRHGGQVDLLLTDVVMPQEIDGVELASRLRVHQPGLRVLYCSGYSEELAGLTLELHPRECFLQKPFTLEQLLETVRRCLDEADSPS